MKKLISVLLAILLVLSMASCAPAAEQSSEKQPAAPAGETPAQNTEDLPYIPVIALGFGHQFWQAVKLGAEQAAEEYGVQITFEGPETETMVDKQVDMLKTALSKDPVAICLAAIDNEAVAADLKAAKGKGIKIVGFDAGCGEPADTQCSTSNYDAGVLAAENAARLMNETGVVAVVGHSQTVVDAVARVEGFVDTIKEKYPDMTIADTQYGEGDHLKSADIAKSMVTAHPEIGLIYASNEGACVGAYNGLKEINKIGQVKLIGFDSSAAMKEAIRKGEIAGAITQDPVGMGYKAVEAAVKLTRGETMETFIDTGCYWYDSTNMDADHIAPLLYD
ncbi:MAG TPA: ABC transporter substrate-binding protein [Feifaniaceae bacterium]|nr:ABC transporter substrate-binding protein [Feifaniaceae bacterium]